MRPGPPRRLLYPLTMAMLTATLAPSSVAVSLPTAPIEPSVEPSTEQGGNRKQRRAERAIAQRAARRKS